MKVTFKIFKNIFWNALYIKQLFCHNGFKHARPKQEEFGRHYFNCYKSKSQKCLTSFGYLTFIGLGSKNVIETTNKKNDPQKTNEWKREQDISHHITLAEVAIKAGDLKKAELILQKALHSHEESKTVGVTCIYDMLATLAYREGDIERAKTILEKVLSYLGTSGAPSDDDNIVLFRLKLARILSKLGNINEADKHFRKCLELQKLKQQVGLNGEDVVTLRINCLFWYGRHLVKNKKFIEAKHCFDTAYTLSAKVKTLENNQVMVILYNLSETLLAIGDREGALHHLLNAVILGRESNSPDLPMYYNKIGMIYLSKGVLREARHWCENGRDRAKQVHNRAAQQDGDNCINRINEMLKLGPLKV